MFICLKTFDNMRKKRLNHNQTAPGRDLQQPPQDFQKELQSFMWFFFCKLFLKLSRPIFSSYFWGTVRHFNLMPCSVMTHWMSSQKCSDCCLWEFSSFHHENHNHSFGGTTPLNETTRGSTRQQHHRPHFWHRQTKLCTRRKNLQKMRFTAEKESYSRGRTIAEFAWVCKSATWWSVCLSVCLSWDREETSGGEPRLSYQSYTGLQDDVHGGGSLDVSLRRFHVDSFGRVEAEGAGGRLQPEGEELSITSLPSHTSTGTTTVVHREPDSWRRSPQVFEKFRSQQRNLHRMLEQRPLRTWWRHTFTNFSRAALNKTELDSQKSFKSSQLRCLWVHVCSCSLEDKQQLKIFHKKYFK